MGFFVKKVSKRKFDMNCMVMSLVFGRVVTLQLHLAYSVFLVVITVCFFYFRTKFTVQYVVFIVWCGYSLSICT